MVARESTSDDLTQDYVDTESRLRHARLVEARLVALLDEAKTVNETLAVQSRLDDVQLRIETDRGRLDNLTRVTSYATIAVTSSRPTPAAAVAAVTKAGDDRPWGLRDALDDAAHNVATPSRRSCAASASRCRSPPSRSSSGSPCDWCAARRAGGRSGRKGRRRRQSDVGHPDGSWSVRHGVSEQDERR